MRGQLEIKAELFSSLVELLAITYNEIVLKLSVI